MSVDLSRHMEFVANLLFGEPNRRLSRKGEMRYGANGSLRIDLEKGVYKDHEHGDAGGVLALIERETGRDQEGCWNWLREHGFEVGEARAPRSNGAGGGGQIRPARPNGASPPSPPPPQEAKPAADSRQEKIAKPEIVATYNFRNIDGDIAFQEVRYQFRAQDGDWVAGEHGKFKKMIRQRRQVGEGWAWDLDGVAPVLYDLPALRLERAEPDDERRIVFLPEGPAKCEALKVWGLLATTNAGGAKNWQPYFADELAGFDVVIMSDHDAPGRARAQTVAKSLHGKASRIRVLDWGKVWPDCPPKGDNVDWRRLGKGTKEKLFEIVEKLKDWVPEPFKSSFGAVAWADLTTQLKPYEWLIRDFLPANERTMIYGFPGSGKSYAGLDMAVRIAQGGEYEGRLIQRCGVIYCAAEGGKGFVGRVEAFRQYHGLSTRDGTPFVVLTRPFDLFSDDDAVKKLRAEIDYWAGTFSVPLGMIALDTVSASSGGMDDGKGNEVARYLGNARALIEGLNTATLFVHHVPKNPTGVPSPRGSGKWTGDFEATIAVNYDPQGAIDGDGRPVRIVKLEKLREGQGHKEIKRFVLRQTDIGRHPDGGMMTACVVVGPGAAVKMPEGKRGYIPTTNERQVFRALLNALESVGDDPPPGLAVPSTVSKVVSGPQLLDAYMALEVPLGDESEETRLNRVRKALMRSGKSLLTKPASPVIGKTERGNQGIYWWTGVPLAGFPETYPRPAIVAPTKPPDDSLEQYEF